MSGAEPPSTRAPHTQPQRRAVLWGARALGYAVYVYLVLTEIMLALGFFLLLFGANPDPPFVQWVYRSLDRAMEPFRGIFTSIELGQTGDEVEAVLDTSVLFAMLVYGTLAWAIHAGITWLTGRLAQQDWRDWQAWQRQQGLPARPADAAQVGVRGASSPPTDPAG